MSDTPAGWYPDGRGNVRWWDGTTWTEHTQPVQPAQGYVPEQPAPASAPASQSFGQPGSGQYDPASAQPAYSAPHLPGGAQSAPALTPQRRNPLLWIILGVVALLVIAVVVFFVFFRGGDKASSPEAAVKQLVNASSCDEAAAVVTGDLKEQAANCDDDSWTSFKESAQSGDTASCTPNVTVGSSTTSGDAEATVPVTTSCKENPEQTITMNFTAVKEGGSWKVSQVELGDTSGLLDGLDDLDLGTGD